MRRLGDSMRAPWRPGATLWLIWALGGSFAWIAAFLSTYILFAFILAATGAGDPAESGLVTFVIMTPSFAAGGAAAGLIQWFLLSRDRPLTPLWIAGAAAGFAAMGVLYSALDRRIPDLAVAALHGILGGAALGLAQRQLLRGRVYDHRLWLPITTAAFAVGALGSAIIFQAAGRTGREGVLPGLFVGIALTALGYIWLRRRRGRTVKPVVGHAAPPVGRPPRPGVPKPKALPKVP